MNPAYFGITEKDIKYLKVDDDTLRITTSYNDRVVNINKRTIKTEILRLQTELVELQNKLSVLE